MLSQNEVTGNSTPRAVNAHEAAQDWAVKIAIARSEQELIAVANGYLATWLPSDRECLPVDCRVSGLSTAEELAHFSVTFVKAELYAPHGSPASSALVDLVRVFVAGQQRLRQLRSGKYDPSAP